MREKERQASQWHIDAFDGKAGIAFISWRTSDLYDSDTILDIPAYTIAPPNFRAEAVSSRSIAFAAGARGFQTGLFDKEAREIGFADIQAIEELVRRLYIALSGRGEPEGGGEGRGEDFPHGGGGGPAEGGELVDRVLEQFRAFRHSAAERSTVTFRKIDWDDIIGVGRLNSSFFRDGIEEGSFWLIKRASEILSSENVSFYLDSLAPAVRLHQILWPEMLCKGMRIDRYYVSNTPRKEIL